ncbi:MAG: tetratricopeptide repeat protein [Deltaproteobacteria bacterium]|nr:tetratricopeptide repeat protein [Deltaproteobacteria bacterium]
MMMWPAGTLQAAVAPYAYEQGDADEDKKRYMVKIEQDRNKCDLAIKNTKALIARSKNRPYLPELLLRLAELTIEKSRLSYFLRKNQDFESKSALDSFESNMLKQQAIEIYQRILSHHPDYEACDKVHFFLAHEFRELEQMEKMLIHYKEIISNYESSAYVPEAHLLLGDYYFNQMQRLDLATHEYEAVLQYPRSPALAIARYKLAWCQINQEDYAAAITLFEASVTSDAARKKVDIDTYRRVDVRLESIVDMAFCYPEVHKKATTEEALAYFRQYAWSRQVYALVLEKLASRYFVKKRWQNAAGIYRQLAILRQDAEKLLEYTHKIFECVQALGSYENAEQDVALIIKALKKQTYTIRVAPAEKEKTLKDFELFARKTITQLHENARKTNSKNDFAAAANAYALYIDFFTESPAFDDMAANYAEALFSAEQYLTAGKQYETFAPKAVVNQKQRQESLYSAVIAYYNALKNKESLNYYQNAYARNGLMSVGKRFITENPNAPRTPDVQFNVAWVAYDSGHFEKAISEFSNFVSSHPNHNGAGPAVHLVLDAFHQLENHEGLIQYGKSILKSNQVGDAILRKEIAQIIHGTESKLVSTMTMAAMDDWDTAKEELIRFSNASDSQMGEQALNALILSSKDKKDLAILFEAGPKLVRSYPESGHVKDTLGILIDTAIKIGQYRLLGDYMEQFVSRFPQHENTTDFILQAAQIREGLGQHAAANRHYRRLLSMGAVDGEQYDNIVFGMVENALKMKNPYEALGILTNYGARLRKQAKIRANAQMATLHMTANRRSKASKYIKLAKTAFGSKPFYDDFQLRDAMGQMIYENVSRSTGPYYALQFKGKIDNTIFKQKSDQLKKLEDRYQQVLVYKSPSWALKACFRISELNNEFARFLSSSPVPPDLNETEMQQYLTILQQNAIAYQDKAKQYIQTGVELAQKQEICDSDLAGYFIPAENPRGKEGNYSPLAAGRRCSEIGSQGFTEEPIADLYQRLLRSPKDDTLQFELAKAYLKRNDYRQAALIAQNTLSGLDVGHGDLKAKLLNLIGISRLDCGEDPLAKDTFKRALKADADLTVARINLAGLFHHYGHRRQAAALCAGIDNAFASQPNADGIHPRAGALFNEIMQTN